MKKDIALIQKKGVPKAPEFFVLEKNEKRKKAFFQKKEKEEKIIKEAEFEKINQERLGREKEEKAEREKMAREKAIKKEEEKKRLEREIEAEEIKEKNNKIPEEIKMEAREELKARRREDEKKIEELGKEIERKAEEVRIKEEARIRKEKIEKDFFSLGGETGEESSENRKKLLLKKKRAIEKEKIELNKKFEQFSIEKKPLDAQKAALLKEIEIIQKGFDIIAEREKKIEEREKAVELKEAAAKNSQEKKQIEKERWGLERKRRDLEKKRWPWDEKLQKTGRELEEIDSRCGKIKIKEDYLIKERAEIFRKEKRIQLELEKIRLSEELKETRRFKEAVKKQEDGFLKELESLKSKLENVLSEEEEIEKNKKLVEKKEEAAKSLVERKNLEKERWEIEENRRKIESQKWVLEEEKEKIEAEQKKIKEKIQKFSGKEKSIIERIKEINRFLEAEGIAEKKISLGPKPIETAESVEPLKMSKPAEAPTSESKEEKKEEIAVVEEDNRFERDRRIEEAKKRIETLKSLREKKKKEREKAAEKEVYQEKKEKESLIEKEKRRKDFSSRLGFSQEKAPKTNFSVSVPLPEEAVSEAETEPLYRRATSQEKIWVRVLVFSFLLVLLAGFFSFWYWYLIIRKQPLSPLPEKITDNSAAEGEKRAENNSKPPFKLKVLSPFFPVDETKAVLTSSSGKIRSFLNQTVQNSSKPNQFKRLIIAEEKENRTLDLEEIFKKLGVKAPEGFYSKIEKDDFLLFNYSQSQGGRIGFVVKIKDKKGLTELLNSREKQMKDDFAPLFSLMGQKGPPAFSYFRDASRVRGYIGPNFRYWTFSREDLGICYLISDRYFVFASSWESMSKVINKLSLK